MLVISAKYINPEHSMFEVLLENDRTLHGPFPPVDGDALSAYEYILANNMQIATYKRWTSLDVGKVAMHDMLSERRWKAEHEFSFNGVPITLDDSTQRRISGAIQYVNLSGTPSVRWQVARGTFIDLSSDDLRALGVAAGAHVQACFANAETLSGLIEAAQTENELLAIDLNEGWP